jgi:hypothetical protein
MFRIFLNINSISYSFRSIANQNGVRYSDSTSYCKKYSSSKCKQTVCLHYALDFHFNIYFPTINIHSYLQYSYSYIFNIYFPTINIHTGFLPSIFLPSIFIILPQCSYSYPNYSSFYHKYSYSN